MASAQTVSAAELRGKNLRHALVVDVRTPAEYAQKRLLMPTALAPVDALDPAAVAQRNGILPDTPVFTLCASGRRAQSAADKFLEAGFRNVRIIEGGIAACQEAGWPIAGQTESSGPPASIERQVRLVAGAIVTLCVLLGILAHPGFLFGALFVGAGLVFAGLTNWCGMALLLMRAPWNRKGCTGGACPPGGGKTVGGCQ